MALWGGERNCSDWAVIWCVLALVLLWQLPIHAFAQATDAVCAEVKIVIEQKLSLERQAFDAKMIITNGLDDSPLENVRVDLLFFDANQSPVVATTDANANNASFFYRTDLIEGITSLESGVVQPKTAANIHWLIIPSAGAGGSKPEGALYYIGARLTYTLNGKTDTVDVVPEYIVVRPQPLLELDYFLPQHVYADDAFTPEIEIAESFTLGVRVKNVGFGTSYSTSIDTAQPKIIDNRQGLLIGFQILSGYVADQVVGKSLLLNFGDIVGGASAVGRWNMVTTLAGQFVEFDANFTHADDLGGAVTSLIKQVRTHTLIRDVRVDLSSRDVIKDFLAKDGDTLRIYESDGIDTAVTDQSTSARLINQNQSSVQLVFPQVLNGFVYARVVDPNRGNKAVSSVVRSDGYKVPQENIWISKERNEDLSWSYYINIFDANSTGQYTLSLVAITSNASISGAVYHDANNNGLQESNEPRISMLEVSLTGVEVAEGSSWLSTGFTDENGLFSFNELKPGIYAIKIADQAGFVNGTALVGNAGGIAEPGKVNAIQINAGTNAQGYLFSKRTANGDSTSDQQADLAVGLVVNPTVARLNDQITLSIDAYNAGAAVATNASVIVDLTEEMELVTQSASMGSYSDGQWVIGDLAVGQTVNLALTVKITNDAKQELPILARIGATTIDQYVDNNSDSGLVRLEKDQLLSDQQLTQGIRALVMLDCQESANCESGYIYAIQSLFDSAGYEVLIVKTTDEYRRALRSGLYTLLWFNGEQINLDDSLMEETQAAVQRGITVIIDHAPRNPLLKLWNGMHLDQSLIVPAAVTINSSVISFNENAWSLVSNTAVAIAHYTNGEVAMMVAPYGHGQVLATGFNTLGLALQETSLAAFLIDQIQIHEPALVDPMLAQSHVLLRTELSNPTKQTLFTKLSTVLSTGITLDSAQPPTARVTVNQADWNIDLVAGQQQLIKAWLKLPAQSLTSSVISTLENPSDNSVLNNWTFEIKTIDLATVIAKALFELEQVAIQNPSMSNMVEQIRSLLESAQSAHVVHDSDSAISSLIAAKQLLQLSLNVPTVVAFDYSLAQWLGLAGLEWHELEQENYQLLIISGDNQTTLINNDFAQPLKVKLSDAQGVALNGHTVVFSLPKTGVSGLFSTGLTDAHVATDVMGVATSPIIKANNQVGEFSVIASSLGAKTIEFVLTNAAQSEPILKQFSAPTPTGTGMFSAHITGGGARCRFNPDATLLRHAEGWLPVPSTIRFPHGVFSFELIDCELGSVVNVTTEWPLLSGINGYFKYGNTPNSPQQKLWYVPTALSGNSQTFSYTVRDGGLGDDDLKINGIIKDPSGPVIESKTNSPEPIPLMSDIARVLLIVLLGVLGIGLHRKRSCYKSYWY